MRILLASILLIGVLTGLLLTVGAYMPGVLGGRIEALLETKAEKERVAQIALLPISDEKKSILMRHLVFKGAAPHMVLLALGEPRQKDEEGDRWHYHFENDPRPTILVFSNGVLNDAYRTSNYEAAPSGQVSQPLPAPAP